MASDIARPDMSFEIVLAAHRKLHPPKPRWNHSMMRFSEPIPSCVEITLNIWKIKDPVSRQRAFWAAQMQRGKE
jgi:hypothetical protein